MVPELIDVDRRREMAAELRQRITDVFEVQSQIATRVAGALGVALGGTRAAASGQAAHGQRRGLPALPEGTGGTGCRSRELARVRGIPGTGGGARLHLCRRLGHVVHLAEPAVFERVRQPDDGPAGQGSAGPNRSTRPRCGTDASRGGAISTAGREGPDLARGEMDLALRASPTDAEVLSAAGLADMGEGDLGSALAKLERAREIDPRSYITLYTLSQVYNYLGRASDGEATAAAALLVRPGDLNAIQWLAISRVSQGKMDEARAGIRSAIEAGVPAPSIAAHFAGFQETSWILDDRERQLVFRLTPSAFDNDRAFWGQSLGMAYWQRGEPARARAYADSALAPSKSQADAAPKDAQLQVLYGLVLALAGKPAEARVYLAKALALNPSAATQFNYILLNGARVERSWVNKDRAAEYLEEVRQKGGFLTPQFLPVDPTYRSLKGNPRFEALMGK